MMSERKSLVPISNFPVIYVMITQIWDQKNSCYHLVYKTYTSFDVKVERVLTNFAVIEPKAHKWQNNQEELLDTVATIKVLRLMEQENQMRNIELTLIGATQYTVPRSMRRFHSLNVERTKSLKKFDKECIRPHIMQFFGPDRKMKNFDFTMTLINMRRNTIASVPKVLTKWYQVNVPPRTRVAANSLSVEHREVVLSNIEAINLHGDGQKFLDGVDELYDWTMKNMDWSESHLELDNGA